MEGVRGQSQDMNEVYDTINRVASRLGIFKDRATALLLRYKWSVSSTFLISNLFILVLFSSLIMISEIWLGMEKNLSQLTKNLLIMAECPIPLNPILRITFILVGYVPYSLCLF